MPCALETGAIEATNNYITTTIQDSTRLTTQWKVWDSMTSHKLLLNSSKNEFSLEHKSTIIGRRLLSSVDMLLLVVPNVLRVWAWLLLNLSLSLPILKPYVIRFPLNSGSIFVESDRRPNQASNCFCLAHNWPSPLPLCLLQLIRVGIAKIDIQQNG